MTRKVESIPGGAAMIDGADLASVSDIARLLGVVPPAVTNWSRRHADYPLPVATVNDGRTPLYSRRAVVAWYRLRIAVRHDRDAAMLASLDSL